MTTHTTDRQPEEDQADFNRWAETYDGDVTDEAGFPFEGYARVLARVVALAAPAPGMKVLELGPGTGNLTAQLVAAGAAVWALDFSEEMLARARAKVPAAVFARGDLSGDYPPTFRRPYDRIVSTYTLHEIPDDHKLALLRRLAEGYLAPGGRIVLGDVGFPTTADQTAVRAAAGEAWDDEFFWVMDAIGPRLRAAGFALQYEQLSTCGVVLALTR